MATNYTFEQMVKAVVGNDTTVINEIGKANPLLLHRLSILSAVAGNELVELSKVLPQPGIEQKHTEPAPTKVEPKAEVVETKAEPKAEETVQATDGPDYESMTRAELMALVRDRKLRKLVKGQKKVDFIEALELADADPSVAGDEEEVEEVEEAPAPKAKPAKKVEEVVEEEEEEDEEDDFEDFEDDEEEEDEEPANPYEGRPAPELYKEAKARGLKAAPRKPVKYYVDLLMDADAILKEEAANVDTDDSDDDDWDI